jgi:hypothetical protein
MVFFKPKIPIWVNFWALEWKMMVYFMVICNSLQAFGIFYGHLVMLWQFGIFSPVLVYCVKKNLATLLWTRRLQPAGISFDRRGVTFCENQSIEKSIVGQHFSFVLMENRKRAFRDNLRLSRAPQVQI